ncbi:hypothetical protein Cgig2_013227 [Carnegiea gigantea]|uniref:Uncharacterized protein n=1 Tax=Carnegiea gigantea TaxID=171969 RepID=A0A9Q1GJR1_9CARY|nr:hypothetical protein Cgig2_013227 [Carnegiea gigantea]
MPDSDSLATKQPEDGPSTEIKRPDEIAAMKPSISRIGNSGSSSPQGTLIRQPVKYEWIPSKCTHCGMFGHEEPVCKKKGMIRREWRQVQDTGKSNNKEPVSTNPADGDGFTPVSRKGSTKHHTNRQPHSTGPAQTQPNTVSSLADHTNQFQLSTQRKFCLTFVYSFNHEQQRLSLWTDLTAMALSMDDAWCIMGDFNSILYRKDRIGGDEVTEHETRDFQNCLD